MESKKPKPMPPAPAPNPPSPAPAPDSESSSSSQATLPQVSDSKARLSDSQDTDPGSALHSITVDQEDASMEASTMKPLADNSEPSPVSSASTAAVTVASTDPAAATSLRVLADVASHDNTPSGHEDKDTAHGFGNSHGLAALGSGMQAAVAFTLSTACVCKFNHCIGCCRQPGTQ